MSYEPLDPARTDPPIYVEAAPTDDSGTADWAEPVVTRPEHRECPHRLYFRDLNPKGRLAVLGGRFAIWSAWLVIVLGTVFGIGGLLGGLDTRDVALAIGSLLMVCSGVLQAVGAIGLALTWRRPHRPSDVVIGLAAVGYLLFVIVVGMILAATQLIGFAFALAPFAFVLWQLISFRGTLYWRGTCQVYPGFPPGINALLSNPGLSPAKPDPNKFSIETCPHRLEFRQLRGSAQVMSIANAILLGAYMFVVLMLTAALLVVDNEREAAATVMALLLPLANLPAFHEVNLRGKRYHRAPLTVSIGAFVGYATTLTTAVLIWPGPDIRIPIGAMLLAAYWAYSAAVAMKILPPRSVCASLREPPPAIQRMLKA
jgi:hypothetical protein